MAELTPKQKKILANLPDNEKYAELIAAIHSSVNGVTVGTMNAAIAAAIAAIPDAEISNTVHMDPEGLVAGSGGATGSQALPYKILSEAWAAAELLASLSGAPTAIRPNAGNYTETVGVTTAGENIFLIGPEMGAAVFNFTGATQFKLASENITLSNASFVRSGSNPAAVLTCSVRSLATWLNDLRINNVHVENAAGVAIGTFTADFFGLSASGMTAMEYWYGAQGVGIKAVAHDPALTAKTYGIRFMQACMATGGPQNSGYTMHLAELEGGIVSATDPNGGGINCITESEIGMFHDVTANASTDTLTAAEAHGLSSGWYVQFDTTGTLPAPLVIDTTYFVIAFGLTATAFEVSATLGGGVINLTTTGTGTHRVINRHYDWLVNPTPTVSFYPPTVHAQTYGPETGGRSAGTGYGIAGTADLDGGKVYGDYALYKYHDAEIRGTKIVCPTTPNTKLINYGANLTGVGVSWVGGNFAENFSHLSASSFTGGNIQNDSTYQLKGHQYMFHGVTDTQTVATGVFAGVIGRESKMPQAVRFLGLSSCISCDSSRVAATTAAYKLATMTVECRFRADATNGNSYLLSNQESGSAGWYIAVVPNSNQIYCGVGGASAIILNSAGVFDSLWHHVAFTVTGGVVTMFVDGVSAGTASGVVLSGAEYFRVAAGPGGLTRFTGDESEIRMSRVNRYPGTTTFEVPSHFFVDGDTIDLWGDQFSEPLLWESLTRNRNLAFVGGASDDGTNWPFLVRVGKDYLL